MTAVGDPEAVGKDCGLVSAMAQILPTTQNESWYKVEYLSRLIQKRRDT
jgi:hypothetical protein